MLILWVKLTKMTSTAKLDSRLKRDQRKHNKDFRLELKLNEINFNNEN